MNNVPRRIIRNIGELDDKDLAELKYLFEHRFKNITDDNSYLRAVLAVFHWLSRTNSMLRPENILHEKTFKFH